MTDLKICDECGARPAFRASLHLRDREGGYAGSFPLGDLCWGSANKQMRSGMLAAPDRCRDCHGDSALVGYIYLRNGRQHEGFVCIGRLCRKCARRRGRWE